MNIVKTCVLRPFSYTFGFDFGLFYENKNFLEGRNRVEKFIISPFSLHSRCSLKPMYHPMVLLPFVAISLKTFML